jgi:hypothetical protein
MAKIQNHCVYKNFLFIENHIAGRERTLIHWCESRTKRRHGFDEFRTDGGWCKRRGSSPKE